MKAIKEFIRLNKKMFYVLCGVIGVFVLILIILLIVKLVSGTKISYEQLQDKMVIAAENYYYDNTETLPKNEGDEISISIDTLVEKGYLKSLDKLVDASCSGSVVVKKNGEQYMYYPSLDCGSDYKTRTIGSIITDQSNIVESGDGLYKTEDGYVFRGEYVNNYVTFADSTWRIISIDNNGNIRMVKDNYLEDDYSWDDRYNVEADDETGINDYKKSRIKESLEKMYNDNTLVDETNKKHLIMYNLCIGKRNSSEYALSKNIDCSETVPAHIGLLSLYEVKMPSLDKNCTNIDTESCGNYNYFSNFMYGTFFLNSVNDNTYEVYAGKASYTYLTDARYESSIYPVIVISSKEIYVSGNGSEENHFIVK